MFRLSLLALGLLVALTAYAPAQPKETFTRTDDVIYGRKFGTALTLDVYTPKEKANGKGIVWCVSGGWFSAKPGGPGGAKEYVDRGYVVFAVVHGSTPQYPIPEVLDDMHRAVRFIKLNAKRFNVDPDKLGITGGSAGGHLSLMQGNAPKDGDPKALDPVDRLSSRVAAVACLYPPTDFLNYGKDGESGLGEGILKDFKAPFEFRELVQKPRPHFVPVTDSAQRKTIGKAISPAYHVTKNSAPALVIHGDADTLVPIQQAELLAPKYKEAGVPYELAVRKGAGHGGPAFANDNKTMADWFDKYLLDK